MICAFHKLYTSMSDYCVHLLDVIVDPTSFFNLCFYISEFFSDYTGNKHIPEYIMKCAHESTVLLIIHR